MTLGILLTAVAFGWWFLGLWAAHKDKDGMTVEAGLLGAVAFAGAMTAFFK